MNTDWSNVFKHGGIDKHWVYASKENENLARDYLEKGKNVVQDFGYHKQDLSQRATVVYVIIMMAWMFDVVELYQKMLREHVLDNFDYSHETEWIQAKRYQAALRSFAVAHPLATNRHLNYAFDGDLICVDISPKIQDSSMFRDYISQNTPKHISLEGTEDGFHENDCLLTIYSKNADNAQYYRYLGFDINDIETAINLCIDKLTELDIYLSKLKKRDFVK